ncbi:MAG: zinc ABC transporter solute-binding protein [Proteobacteria bacterium]|nr:zinc ABC transporter solute-binding protein [Pseudomonadota bacterium]NIS69132.1 zinc ABC transporter solute-binding protein [Pseudomonadota bacterium]
MTHKKVLLVTKALAFIYISCAAIVWSGESPSDKLTVYVVNYPLKYFAERIAGDHTTVVFPAPADQDPAFWMPDAKIISDYQSADLILLNGANYAKWVGKVSLPQFRLVNTSASFKDQYIETAEIVTHSHGPEGEHAHEALAFTTWIDFSLAAKQAKAIAQALSRKKPALRESFDRNYRALEKDLMTLDRDIKEIVLRDPSKPLVASHPVYDYFASRYGLNIRGVHWEPDEVPSREQWVELRDILKDHPAKWMIWEGDPISEPVERLKTLGMDSLVFDPCGNIPERGDFLAVMQQNVENLKIVFQ